MCEKLITKRPLFYWVFHKFRSLQFALLVVIIVSLFFRVFPLEMQKRIVNHAIHLKKLDLLYLYCGLYFGSVIIASSLKYTINMLQAWIGQKILLEMRRELYQHILQLPLQFFRNTQAGTVMTSMTSELNSIGFFLGGALAIPVTSILTFTTFLAFMIYLNPLLGILTVSIYPFEFIVIPYLQKRYNELNKKRVQTTREMANTVNEAISGIHEVHGNGSFQLENRKLDFSILRLYELLRRLFFFKYGIKFSNNLFQSVGPFLLFLVGGYFTIKGNFTIGALVAFLSAFEKVYDPWKEMIEYYQFYQDAQIRYRQIMETFDQELPYQLEPPPERAPYTLTGDIEATDISYTLDGGVQLLDQISFKLKQGEHLALVGYSGSGKSTLSYLISQLYGYTEGTLTLDACEIEEMCKLDISNNLGFVAQHPFLFTGTIKENLLYPCQALQESFPPDKQKPLPGLEELIEIIRVVGLEDDVLKWGLKSIIPLEQIESFMERLIKMRKILREDLRNNFKNIIEFYDIRKFLEHSSIGTNIIFGEYQIHDNSNALIKNQAFRKILNDQNLEAELVDMGRQLASVASNRLGKSEENTSHFKEDLDNFLLLALNFIPEKHKEYTIDDEFKKRILVARTHFLLTVANANGETFSTIVDSEKDNETEKYLPYHTDQYLSKRTLIDNILWGTLINRELFTSKFTDLVLKQFSKYPLVNDILEIGLNFHIGAKGDRLSGGQQQKIALARIFLKKSPILILDEATASLDNLSQFRIQQYIEKKLKGNTTVIAVIHRLDMVSGYDNIIVLKAGKIVETGNYDSLMASENHFYKLATMNS